MQEIGSEFHLGSCEAGENRYLSLMPGQREFILSGRTGLGYIAEDLLLKHRIGSIALPAYCCGSIVEPFTSKKIEARFYDSSSFREIAQQSDAVLLMDYFGFSSPETLQNAEFCKEKGIPLIIDATQTAFSRLETYELCDYLVCSYRKWSDCLCAAVYCRDGFEVSFSESQSPDYVSMWRKASREKEIYLKTGQGNKQQFLERYGAANRLLGDKHDRLAASLEEVQNLKRISSGFLRKRRKENAGFLIKEIEKNKQSSIRLLFSRQNEEECPLFLPILLPADKRTEIRRKLIEQQIYCPVHWPIDKNYPYKETTLHHEEMSLICDQRYDLKDMERIISVLYNF